MIAFPYFGGKSASATKTIAVMPPHEHYVEPYGGSMAVLLAKAPVKLETYNDLDGCVVAFFRVLRDRPDELLRVLRLTPYSREEYKLCCSITPDLPELERARRFYVRARQAFNAIPRLNARKGWRFDRNMGRQVPYIQSWLNSIEGLMAVAERLRTVQIENKPALQVMRGIDIPEALWFVDPPYVPSTLVDPEGYYNFNMTDADHAEMAAVLVEAKAKVILCGYPSGLYKHLFPGWHQIDMPQRLQCSKRQVTESLWLNFDPMEHLPLFNQGKIEVTA